VEYLNLQRILKTVVKNKDYKEAHAIQDRMNSLAEAEKKQWELQQQARSEHHLAQLRKSQQKELASLHKRADCGMNELQKQRSEEYQTLVKKYQNKEKATSSLQIKMRSALLGLNASGVLSTTLLRPVSARLGRSSASPGELPPKTSKPVL
jgi:hypothetical protein